MSLRLAANPNSELTLFQLNSFNDPETLLNYLREQQLITLEQQQAWLPLWLQTCATYPLLVPQNWAAQIARGGPTAALWRQFFPSITEINENIQAAGMIDPIEDQKFQVAPQLIHRYHNRALFTPIIPCPVNCRYCFRKNELLVERAPFFKKDFPATLNYLAEHPEIQEVIFTGGDPLLMSNKLLKHAIAEFSNIKSLQFIRFHTRTPVLYPERIDHEFLEIIDQFKNRFHFTMILHTNHRSEWFLPEQFLMLKKLQDVATSMQLLAQTVLLKNVNNDVKVLNDLFQFLIQVKIRPYYLHHPDRVTGGMHFGLDTSEGLKLYQALRQTLPGWALPHYVTEVAEFSEKRIVH